MELLKKEVCFLSKNHIYLTKNDNNYSKDIILSPYYYWYFQRKLPTSNKKRALKILPQIVSSLLPHENFKFVLKQIDKQNYEVFALDLELVKKNLQSKGVSYSKVSNFGFSHIEFEDGSYSLKDAFLLKQNGQACETKQVLSRDLNEQSIEEVLKNIQKLSFKISGGNSTFLEKGLDFLENNANALIVAIAIIIVANIVNITTTNSLKNSYETQKEALLLEQKYAEHAVQLKYIKDNFMQTDFEQKAIRMKLEKLSSLKTNASLYLDSFELENKIWQYEVKAVNKESADGLLTQINPKFIKHNKGIFYYEDKN